jgi:hypothetical protein
MTAPADGGGAMVVTCGGGKAREARNTPGFLEEQREGREGHWSQQIDKEFPRLHCLLRRGKVCIHVAHGFRVGKMFTGGRRGSACSCLVAQRGWVVVRRAAVGSSTQWQWQKGARAA